MIGSEILTQFGQIIDQEGNNPLDVIFAYQLMNTARKKLEELTDWEYLKKKWSITTTALPTDFNKPIKITDNKCPVYLHSFEDYELYDDGYYIDYANSTINAIGIYSVPILTYKRTADNITADTSPAFPKFHEILAYEMAYIYQTGIDGDDLNFRMSTEHKMQHAELKRMLLAWDSDIKLRNMNGKCDYDPRYSSNNGDINII